MKKIVSFIISFALFVGVFAFPVSAASTTYYNVFSDDGIEDLYDGASTDYLENFYRNLFNISSSSKVVFGNLLERDPIDRKIIAYFVEFPNFEGAELIEDSTDSMFRYWNNNTPSGISVAAVLKFVDGNGQYVNKDIICHTVKFVYKENVHQYDIIDETDVYSNKSSFYLATPETTQRYRVITLDDWSGSDVFHVPDTVFTYTVKPSSWSLVNGTQLEVDINFTSEYLQWVRAAHNKYPDYSSYSYDFLIYISSVRPTNSSTLLDSMNNSVYSKLNYGNYLYDGGYYSYYLSNNPSELLDGGDSSSSEPLLDNSGSLYDGSSSNNDNSASSNDSTNSNQIPNVTGKSAWTYGQGVHIGFNIDPLQVESLDFPIYVDNITGFDTHTPIYVCVLGAFAPSGVCSPNSFNYDLMTNVLQGHSTPNDTYCEFDDFPALRFHSYYMPFDCITQSDGYASSSFKTKAQTMGGGSYQSNKRVTDYTNKALKPDYLQDNDMREKGDTWTKTDDYFKWRNDNMNNSKYTKDFTYDTTTLKDVFSQEGDFFQLLTACFSVFPSYVINIFVGFIICLFAIVIVKLIL